VADIRPFLGLHNAYKPLGIFNGLGTKGALLGPYFAHQMACYLLGKGGLDQEVDIKRFEEARTNGHFFRKNETVNED
jgi:glycine/D-amino acid oxidase-like deaminating enzyme